MKRYLLILLLPVTATAQPYFDVGLSYFQQAEARPQVKLNNPLGHAEAGYRHKRIKVFIRHTSSIPDSDYGINEVGVSMRLFGSEE